MKIKVAVLIISLIVLLSSMFYWFQYKQSRIANDQADKAEITEELKIERICGRTTRWDNLPQYDRALSLIQQRISENNSFFSNDEYKDSRFNFFPPELVNCIKINEKDMPINEGLEGYFIFEDDSIKRDYFPITVSKNYKYADDITTALLLVHEMTHVQQYLDSLENARLDCIESEVQAFEAQLDFYVTLSGEENNSVYQRIQNDNDPHTQIQMLKAMTTINRERALPVCGFDKDCSRGVLRKSLRDTIRNDEVYKKQCSRE